MRTQDIIQYLDNNGIEYSLLKYNDDEITGFSSLFNYKKGTLTFIAPERKFEDYKENFDLESIQFMILCQGSKTTECFRTAIEVKDSRAVFFDILDNLLAVEANENVTGISTNPAVYQKHSFISETAQIGENVKIGVGCVIEGDVVIGDNTEIHHNVVIRNKTKIGKRCTINSGVIIGEYGFGYVVNADGEKEMLKHYGGVTVEDDVHIGDNCIIIRGAIDDTVIQKGAKLNTLVHVAHNDNIGKRTLITSPCHICGSVTIGDDCHIAGMTIRNQRTVENNAVVGLGAVVVKNVEEGTTVVGNPARVLVK